MKKINIIGIGLVSLLITVISVFAKTDNPGPIESAKLASSYRDDLHYRAKYVGLECGWFERKLDDCSKLTSRAERNVKLKTAFLKANAAYVLIRPASFNQFSVNPYSGAEFLNPFSIGKVHGGYIQINTWYSDESIIAYLNGE